jgi:hypothetical protein
LTLPPSCTNHCRACGHHFTSLRAFDAHRRGPMDARRCEPPGPDLAERIGICRLAGPDLPIAGGTLYERADSRDYRERMNARHAASRHAKSRLMA